MARNTFMPKNLRGAWGNIGPVGENLRSILAMGADIPDYVRWFDHFVGDSAGTWPASANWGYPATAGTGTEVITLEALAGGQLLLTTGANANDSAGQGVGLHWTGDNWIYFVGRISLDSITTSIVECGLTDSLADDTGAVATKATPTFTATDCALFVRDTTDDTNLTFVSNGGTTDANADWSGTFSAGTWYTIEVVVGGPSATTGDNATGYVNGQRVGSGNINGATLLTPWFYVETLTTATRGLSVDYGGCVGRISAS